MENKIKMLALLSIFVMLCASVSISGPVSAAKVKAFKVDQGHNYFYDGQSGYQKNTWKTYLYTNNKRKVFQNIYIKEKKKYVASESTNYTLMKVSKTRIKLTRDYWGIDDKHHHEVAYVNTKLSTRLYYWYVFRKQLIKDPHSPGPFNPKA
jgi:hypothetical protein